MTAHTCNLCIGRMRQEDQKFKAIQSIHFGMLHDSLVYSIAQLEHNKFISCPISSLWHAIYKTLGKFTKINHDVTAWKACPWLVLLYFCLPFLFALQACQLPYQRGIKIIS